MMAGCTTSPQPDAEGGPTTDRADEDAGHTWGAVPYDLVTGDIWNYSSERPGVVSTIIEEVQAVESMTAAGGTHEAYRISQRIHATHVGGGFGTTNTTSWMRTSDHALLRSSFEVNALGETFNGTAEYEQPCRHYHWPLEVGNSWTSSCKRQDGHSETTTFRVDDLETVTVPAGTFQAYRITQQARDGTTTTTWHADAACGTVKEVSIDAQGTTMTTVLQSYAC